MEGDLLPLSADGGGGGRAADASAAWGRGVAWAAVSIADKLDTLVGLFAAGERPTGSRDPFGLRRQAHGLFKVLVDLPELTELSARPTMGVLVDAAAAAFASGPTPLDEAGRTALYCVPGRTPGLRAGTARLRRP